MKTRTGTPWIPAPEYGALLPQFSVNLIVRDIDVSLDFYRQVLRAEVHYADQDFAAVRVLGAELMLHVDHTYEGSPWRGALESGETRGLGAELRLLGMNPEDVAERARAVGALFKEVAARGHGWREVMVQDPDGYVWAVGVIHRADT
ncbi:MAG TPA: VOC family protein [Caulobacteraceae bacterium]|nr:VOC family protein [Caulobacteraceae bacterium]